ncbi:MAG: AsnC family transcriptional regulator [Candidatus Bathyarchaeia archaeon]|jgi:DNA-binding Lrp family transcriptional regulator
MKEEKLVKLLKELIRNSRRSDRELAKTLKVSQPTVTRNRKLAESYVRSYTVVPDFQKIGYEIFAITFAKAKTYDKKEVETKLEVQKKWVMQHPNVFFASDGEGLGKDAVILSLHKDYSKYADFMREYTINFAEFISDVQSFIVSLKTGMIIKPFDLKYLAEDL